MPTYTIRDPQTGKTVKLTGDSPPSEAELTDIFAKLGGSADAPAAPKTNAEIGQMKPADAMAYLQQPRIGPSFDDRPGGGDAVTLGDIQDNPADAFKRIGAIVKRDLTDPKMWVAAAASYFGPRVVSSVVPIAARTMRAAPRAAVRGVAKIGDVVSPDVIGIISPRAGRIVETAQRFDKAIQPATTSGAVGTARAGAGVVRATSAAPAPVAPAPPQSTRQVPGKAPSQARRPGATATQPAVPPALKLKLTVEEFQAAKGLIEQGYAPNAVLEAIQRQRLPEAWRKLPSNEQVRASVTDRNATGQWPEAE